MNIGRFIHILSITNALFYVWILHLLAEKTLGEHRFKSIFESILVPLLLYVYISLFNIFHYSFIVVTFLNILWHISFYLIFYGSGIKVCVLSGLYMAVAGMISESGAYICVEKITGYRGNITHLPEWFLAIGSGLAKMFLLICTHIFIFIYTNIQKRRSIPNVENKYKAIDRNRREVIDVSLPVFLENISIPCISSLLLVAIVKTIRATVSWILIIVCIFGINIFAYKQYHRLKINEINRGIYDDVKARLRLYKEQLNFLYEEWMGLRKFRHDIKKQYLLEQTYLVNGSYDMLKQEYHKVVDMVSPCAVITGNMIIDAVVYSRKMLAMEKNIAFDYNIKFPQDIAVNDSDMNRLLGNILDNAINAAEAVSGSTDERCNEAAFVKLKLSYEKGNLYMECVNSCNNSYAPVKYNDVIIPDHPQQGLGIPIIKDIVDMYNGTLKAYIANNKIFVLKLLLYDIESRA